MEVFNNINLFIPLFSRTVLVSNDSTNEEVNPSITKSYGITHGHSISNSINKYLYLREVNENQQVMFVTCERFNVIGFQWQPNLVFLSQADQIGDSIVPSLTLVKIDGNQVKGDKAFMSGLFDHINKKMSGEK